MIAGGNHGLLTRMAQCCSPAFPDQICAIARVSGEMMIHNKDCAAILQANPDRVYDAFWEMQEGSTKRMKLRFDFDDTTAGILVKIINIAYSLGVNILSHEGGNTSNKNSYVQMEIEGRNVSHTLAERFFNRAEFEIPEFIHGKVVTDDKEG